MVGGRGREYGNKGSLVSVGLEIRLAENLRQERSSMIM
jgi:hypothetical protein